MMTNVSDQSALGAHLQARLAVAGIPCGSRLVSYYTTLVEERGKSITTEDAFATWLRWLSDAGGRPERPLTADQTHERIAGVLREVARYG